MNVLIAVFLYLGLTYSGDTITRQEVIDHQQEIDAAKSTLQFWDFYNSLSDDAGSGITLFDIKDYE